MDDSFDAVYYPKVIPTSLSSLTRMALVFDKVYFPEVYIPTSNMSSEEIKKQINRMDEIIKEEFDERNTFVYMRNMYVYKYNEAYIKDFCVFTGGRGSKGSIEDGSQELAKEIEELYWGPPPENFFPTYNVAFFDGSAKDPVNGLGEFYYPANAFLYSQKHGLPLINDEPSMPVPAVGGIEYKSNAKALASLIALKSIDFILPKTRVLNFEEIAEFREKNKEYVKPFRIAMLKITNELNQAINSDMTFEEIEKEANFLVETKVYPEMMEMKKAIEDKRKPWVLRATEAGNELPDLVMNFANEPFWIAIAKVSAKAATLLADIAKENKEIEKMKTGLYYLLTVRNV